MNKQNHLIIIVSVSIFLFLAGGFTFIVKAVNDAANNIYSENQQEITRHDVIAIQQKLDSYVETVKDVTEDIRTWHNYDHSDVLMLLKTNSKLVNDVESLVLFADDGTYYESSGTVENYQNLVEVCSNLTKPEIFKWDDLFSSKFVDLRRDKLVFIVPVDPFFADGHNFRWAMAIFITGTLESEFSIQSYEGKGWNCICDLNGNIIVNSAMAHREYSRLNFLDYIVDPKSKVSVFISEIKEKLYEHEAVLSYQTKIKTKADSTVEPVNLCLKAVPDTDWILVSVTPSSVFKKQTMLIKTVLIVLLAFVFSVIIGILIYFMRQKNLQEKATALLLNQFSDSYLSVYLVNKKDNSYDIIRQNDYLKNNYPLEANFTIPIDKYIQKDVYAADRQILYDATRPEYILERLNREESFKIRYRDTSYNKNSFRWFEMFVTRIEGRLDSYIISFVDNHDTIVKNFVQSKIFESYYDVYYVDLVQNKFKSLKNENNHASGTNETNSEQSWTDFASHFICKSCVENSQNVLLENIANIKNLQNSIKLEHHREYLYKLENLNNKWQRIAIESFEQNADEVTSVIIGIINLDDFAAEKQELSSKLEVALENAEVANREKTLFLNNMSHDIRTPMNAILGFTEIARKNIDNKEKISEALGKIGYAGEHLLTLINDVLDMSRIESGKIEIKPEQINVKELSAEIHPIFEALAKAKNINFEIFDSSIKDCYIKVDKLRLNQVIINVVSNAIKYTNNGGNVKLEISQVPCERQGFGSYVFKIIDNGIGMSKEFLEHVFDSFSREQRVKNEKYEGTGLGLSIVKRLVELMGGTIGVESEQGVGSTFTITMDFEIVAQPVVEVREKKVTYKKGSLKGKHILLVDDNEFNREITHEVLEEQGVVVEEAVNGKEAFEKIVSAGAEYFDCVLMDVQMPVMNGYEATKAVRALGGEFEKLPIIALSANAFQEDIQTSKASGMSEHLSKPVKVNELLRVLNEFV